MTILRKVLVNKQVSCKSVWFMRQAGRYLPEFRKIRSSNTNFINLCLNSNLSSEITMQPIHRYDLDAAIIFSDILMVPYALGQNITFTKNRGPRLSKFNLEIFLDNDEENFIKKLNPVYKAIELTRKKLDKNKSLISFIGAPWTLIIYMLNLNIFIIIFYNRSNNHSPNSTHSIYSNLYFHNFSLIFFIILSAFNPK